MILPPALLYFISVNPRMQETISLSYHAPPAYDAFLSTCLLSIDSLLTGNWVQEENSLLHQLLKTIKYMKD